MKKRQSADCGHSPVDGLRTKIVTLERRLESAERVVDITLAGTGAALSAAITLAQEHRRNFPKEPDNG